MSGIVITDLRKPIQHPGRTPMSQDERHGRGVIDIRDPDARYPNFCSECGANSCYWNPLKFVPVTRDPKKLAHAYLYKALCAQGCRGRDA